MNYIFSDMEVIYRMRNRRLFLFLDFDGTLAPIAQKPQNAAMGNQTRKILMRMRNDAKIKIAVISGRSLSDIKQITALEGIIYAGNHGLEMEGPDFHYEYPLPAEYREKLRRIKEGLVEKLGDLEGILFEEKGCGLSIHYRNVPPEKQPEVMRRISRIDPALFRNCVKPCHGKMVYELRPSVKWNKGAAVMWLLKRYDLADGDNRLYPVYLGDDRTDEDAFEVLKGKGLTVAVEKKEQSAAQYYLNNTGEVTRFLGHIADVCMTSP